MNLRIKLAIIGCFMSFYACEDVIDVDVPTASPRLVVEASLDWEKGTLGNEQVVELSLSSPYFDTATNTAVTGALVQVTNMDTNEVFVFADANNGLYTTASFVPVLGDTYQLEINYNNQTYSATETLIPGPDIKRLTQSTEGGFDDELLELNLYFDDPEDEENFYLIRYQETGDLFATLKDLSDEFTNGNEIHNFWEKDEDEDANEYPFEVGDVVDVDLYGISEPYYNYMKLLIEQYNTGGNPFSATPAEIRGNCINETNPENYAFGYFRVVQVDSDSYTFE
ncbi:DUF4249 domain-containing protein [Bizionia sp. KMM 8389]